MTNALGTLDSVIPNNARIYLFTGGQHGVSGSQGNCAYAPSNLDYRPLLRALLVALKEWVANEVLPPDNKNPRIDDGTLVRAENVDWPPIPDVLFPGSVVNRGWIYDYGPYFDDGIITQVLPTVLDREYQTLVPQVDADGNDIAGIRLPIISVPLATRTGWNVFDTNGPAAGTLCRLRGSAFPFPATKDERLASGDPRLSIEERYPDHGTYVNKVARAVNVLVKDRFLLVEDAQIITTQAAQSEVGLK